MKTLDITRIIREGEIVSDALRSGLETLDSNDRENLLFNFSGKFLNLVLDNAVSSYSFKHNLGYKPNDVIMLSNNPSTSTVTWEYESFTNENLVLTTTGAVTIRCLIGKYVV